MPDKDLELPAIIDESQSADPAAASAALGSAGGEGEETASRPDSGSKEPDPSAPASSDEKRGPGRPPKFQAAAKPKDGTYAPADLDKMRKDAVAILFLDVQRKNQAQQVLIDELRRDTAGKPGSQGNLLDEAIAEGVAAAVDTVSNLAAIKLGPAARFNSDQRTRLISPWTRVAKLYLGQYAEYSPLAAAGLATIGVFSEKFVEIQMATQGTSFHERPPMQAVA